MNKRDFLLKLAVYYKIELKIKVKDFDNTGKMKDIINPDLEIVGKWLDSQGLSDNDLEQLFVKVTMNFNPTSFIPFPKLKFFDEMLNGDLEARAERAWESLKGLSAMDSYVFEDLRIQQVIESMSGNICSFVQWKDSDKGVWCKKEFIRLYINECKNPRKIDKKILLGHIDLINKNNYQKIGKYGIRYRGSDGSRLLSAEEFKQIGLTSEDSGINNLIKDMTEKVSI